MKRREFFKNSLAAGLAAMFVPRLILPPAPELQEGGLITFKQLAEGTGLSFSDNWHLTLIKELRPVFGGRFDPWGMAEGRASGARLSVQILRPEADFIERLFDGESLDPVEIRLSRRDSDIIYKGNFFLTGFDLTGDLSKDTAQVYFRSSEPLIMFSDG